MKRITVLLVDDSKFLRAEFRKILERESDLKIVSEAKNGLEAVAMVKQFRPSVVLMDIGMPLLNGLESTCRIVKAVPATKVLILSAHSDETYIDEAMNSGAMGYLIKQTSAEIVCSAIRKVHTGGKAFSSSIARRLHKTTPTHCQRLEKNSKTQPELKGNPAVFGVTKRKGKIFLNA
jgi:DNA-binding NarL/FixJ family response regulator